MYEKRKHIFTRGAVTHFPLSRRHFLALASSFAVTATSPVLNTSLVAAPRPRFSMRKLALVNIHTQETFEGMYWREGRYDQKALRRLAYVLRDRRNHKQHPLDPEVFDILHRLQTVLGTRKEYQIICGYRSPETNETLRRTSSGVAKKSLHCLGKAIDLRIEGLPLKNLRDAALSLRAGGVGYYPKSNFIHVDKRAKPASWG